MSGEEDISYDLDGHIIEAEGNLKKVIGYPKENTAQRILLRR